MNYLCNMVMGRGATIDSQYQEGHLGFSTEMKGFVLPKKLLECVREESDAIRISRVVFQKCLIFVGEKSIIG